MTNGSQCVQLEMTNKSSPCSDDLHNSELILVTWCRYNYVAWKALTIPHHTVSQQWPAVGTRSLHKHNTTIHGQWSPLGHANKWCWSIFVI